MLNVCIGTMGSGKTLDLLAKHYNLKSANKKVCTLVPKNALHVISSRAMKEEITPDFIADDVLNVGELLEYDYILVDEMQFLSAKAIEQLKELSLSKEIYMYGLLNNFEGKAFNSTIKAIQLADGLKHFSSYCEICGQELATHHIKKGDSNLDKNSYKAVCYSCFKKEWNNERKK